MIFHNTLKNIGRGVYIMREFTCSVCGYIYDEAEGVPADGILPGTKWEDLPDDWVCPMCGAPKVMFDELMIEITNGPLTIDKSDNPPGEIRSLSFAEMSALCSNLSKGCEKQYKKEESDLFNQLAGYFKRKAGVSEGREFNDIKDLIKNDLELSYPSANSVIADSRDRGTLRALVWGEKVTKILKTVLMRYDKKQNALLEDTNIFVCEICGFVYIGDEPPERCPVCKVPKMKIAKIQRR